MRETSLGGGPMSWAVTGARGMLGVDLVQTLRAADVGVVPLGRGELDILDPMACLEALADVDVVVNCAAWTDVDGAEAHEAEAFAVNAVGASNVARACSESGAVLVQLSTDYVFSGQATEPYAVSEPLAPINAYGRGKAAGEWAVRAECERSYVVRTAWLYGEHGPNFVRTILRLAEERETIDVVDDQQGQPTWTRDLAAFIHDLVRRQAPFGTYHGTSAHPTTWCGFAREIFVSAGLDPRRIRPTSSSSFGRPAARPAYSVLATTGGAEVRDYEAALREAQPLRWAS